MIYYKATRPDGKSFHDGKTAWAVGETVKIKRKDRKADLCGVGILHASDAPGETLIGGRWPCRLFEVEGKPVAQEDHKFGFHELTVIRELPAWQALGPNGEAVAALIERARTITPEQAERLRAARYAARDAARYAAWSAAWNAARYAATDATWDAARYAARNAAWYAARHAARHAARDAAADAAADAARSAARYAAWSAAWNAARHAARDAAADAARDAARYAALALVVRELISEEDFQVLYGPWASVMEVEE